MYNHTPENYDCPFYRIVKHDFAPSNPMTRPEDIILQTSLATAFIASRWWPNNPGHVLIIPNEHFENIYDLPSHYAAEIHNLSQKVAIAFKTVYKCDGVTTRQHNEPAGNQDVWHYHLHVFSRYQNDAFYELFYKGEWTTLEQRLPYAQKLQDYFLK